MSNDPINPKHYKHLPAEAIDIIMAAIAKAPSNESACLHGQVLKYILRCWEKKGIEDLRKAKWYLDRMVMQFDDLLAEINAPILEGAIEQPEPSKTQPPSDAPSERSASLAALCSETKTDAVELAMMIAAERFGGSDGVFNGAGFSSAMRKLSGVNCNLDGFVVAAILCGRSDVKVLKGGSHYQYLRYLRSGELQQAETNTETPGDEPSQPAERPKDFIENFFGGVAEILGQSPPKRFYREPTMEDLKDGPIDCEYRDKEHQQWRRGLLVYILSGSMPFLCTDKELSGQWDQCRIEVAE